MLIPGIAFDFEVVFAQINTAMAQLDGEAEYPDELSASDREGPRKWAVTDTFDNELDTQARKIGRRAQVLRTQLEDLAEEIKKALADLASVEEDASVANTKLNQQVELTSELLGDLTDDGGDSTNDAGSKR